MAAPPTFLQALPAETDATDGDIVTFQVKVSDDPADPTAVSWWRCGESVAPAAGRREAVAHADGWHELVLSNVAEEDEGEYECRAHNSRGHNSCFGSLYYYREGAGTLTDITLEGTAPEEGEGRQSGLLILIDDGSQTEESASENNNNRKSMTVSEQMQGIIEDLTHVSSSDGDRTGSMTIDKDEDDDGQFDSDLDEDDIQAHGMQEIFGMAAPKATASEETLVPEVRSPERDQAVSEGAPDPFAGRQGLTGVQPRWRSDPDATTEAAAAKRGSWGPREGEMVWPPEAADAPFEMVTLDTATTSVELPFGGKSSSRGTETPFDVADITEEEALADGSTSGAHGRHEVAGFAESAAKKRSTPQAEETSLTSVTELSEEAPFAEGWQGDKMSFSSKKATFKSSSYRYTGDEAEDVRMTSTSVRTSTSSRVSSATFEEDSASTAKRSKLSAAYETDEYSVSLRSSADGKSVSAARAALYAELNLGDAPPQSKGLDVYQAIMDFKPMESDEEAVPMKEGQQVEIIDASKPRRWLVRTRPLAAGEPPREGWVPACYLEKSTAADTLGGYVVSEPPMDAKQLEAVQNREAIVKELVETEEDFAKDMQYVVDHYYSTMEDPSLPKEIRDRKGSIFGNFKDISDFHNNVLMKGVYYHAKEPTRLGKTFLRLERDFDMHANYCWEEARAQRLLKEGPIREFFDEHSRSIHDDKYLNDHLKLPIQRLNDYQLLLKELIKYSNRLEEDTSDLQKALEFIHSINKRNKDLQLLQAIQGCSGDLLRIGRVLKHDVFEVTEGSSEVAVERYVFLFKGRVFITQKESSATKDTYKVTNLFKIQDVEVITEGSTIAFRPHKRSRPGFPIVLRSRSPEQRGAWEKEIAAANQVIEDLGDLEPSIEHPPSDVPDNLELKHKAAEPPTDEEQQPDQKKPKVDDAPKTALKRTGSVLKKTKSSDSTPSTPTEGSSEPPNFSRQESVGKKQKKSKEEKPAAAEKPKGTTRQDSKEPPEEVVVKAASGKPEEGVVKAVPGKPEEGVVKAAPGKPEEGVVKAAPGTPEVATAALPAAGKKVVTEASPRPEAAAVTSHPAPLTAKPGEDLAPVVVPLIVMSEDNSGATTDVARVESVDMGGGADDSATVGSGSFRSDDDGSATPPASGAYRVSSSPPPSSSPHFPFLCPTVRSLWVFLVVPVLCACYFVTQYLGSSH